MNDITEAIQRTALSYTMRLILTYFIGKQINTNKSYFGFALSITLGSLIANMGFDINLPFLPLFGSFLTLISIYFLISYLSFRSRLINKFISGKPTVVIENGETHNLNMKKEGLSNHILYQQLRDQGTFDMSKVKLALLEANGKLSVLKNDTKKNASKTNNSTTKDTLPLEINLEGKIITENLTETYNNSSILQECTKRGISLDRIHYGVVSTNGILYLIN